MTDKKAETVEINDILYKLYCCHCDLYMHNHCTAMGGCQYQAKGEVTKAIAQLNRHYHDKAVGCLEKELDKYVKENPAKYTKSYLQAFSRSGAKALAKRLKQNLAQAILGRKGVCDADMSKVQ